MKKNIINYVIKRLNISTIFAIVLISTQLRILLSDKEILIAIVTFIIALFHKK